MSHKAIDTIAVVSNEIISDNNGMPLDPEAYVSMNMWGLTPGFLDILEAGFGHFFETAVRGNPLQAEYLLPVFIGEMLREGRCSVKVLPTADQWFGITYKEDKAIVVDSFKKLISDGVYRSDLYSDLLENK